MDEVVVDLQSKICTRRNKIMLVFFAGMGTTIHKCFIAIGFCYRSLCVLFSNSLRSAKLYCNFSSLLLLFIKLPRTKTETIFMLVRFECDRLQQQQQQQCVVVKLFTTLPCCSRPFRLHNFCFMLNLRVRVETLYYLLICWTNEQFIIITDRLLSVSAVGQYICL